MSGWRWLAAAPTAAVLLAGTAGCSSPAKPAAPHSPTAAQSPAAAKKTQRTSAVRGVVTAVTAASITVRAENGAVRTFPFGLKTRVRRDGADASVADLRVGERVAIFVGSGGQGVRRIIIRTGGSSPSPSLDPVG